MRSLKRSALHSILVSTLITLSMAALALGARPAEAAPFVYVTNANAATVSVIATALNSVVATVPVGQSPKGAAITPNRKFVYVTNSAVPGTVSVIATASNKVVATVNGVFNGPTGVAIARQPTAARNRP